MNLDKIKDPVQADNVEGRDRELERKITLVKIKYVEEMYGASGEFFDMFLRIINFPGPIIGRFSEQQKKINPALLTSELDILEENFKKDTIESLEKELTGLVGDQRVSRAYDFINSVEAQYPPSETQGDSKKFGLLRFNITRAEDEFESNLAEELGLWRGDTLTEIHLEDFFKLQEEKIGVNKIREWFSQLAEYIVDKSPETRGVVGNSWLFGHPVMKRLGFKIVKEFKNEISGGGSYWAQLIGKNGEIDGERLDFLEKNKRLPYDKAIGFIDIEDFLHKYLPAAKKGLVRLKKIDRKYEKRMEALRDTVEKELKSKWNQIISGEISLDTVYPQIQEYLDFLEANGFKEYFTEFIEECVRRKLTMEAVRADQDLIKKFRDRLENADKLVLNKRYVEYEVVID